MILLTKYDNTKILVHLDSVKCIEASSDTRVFFMNGDMIMVKESLIEIQSKTVEFRSRIQQGATYSFPVAAGSKPSSTLTTS